MAQPVLQTELPFSLGETLVKVIGLMQNPYKYFNLYALTMLRIVSKELSYVVTPIINNCTRFDVSDVPNEKIKFDSLKLKIKNQLLLDKKLSSLARQLSRMKKLTHLCLSNTYIGQIGALALVKHGALSNSLKHLDISHTHIQSADMIKLIPIIGKMTELTHLNIAKDTCSLIYFRCDQTETSDDVIMTIAPYLALMTNLTHLNLGGHIISPTCATTLATSLSHIDRLTDINLFRCGLYSSAITLVSSFSRMTNLTCINLFENNIHTHSMAELASCFVDIPKLTKLDLSCNFISDIGGSIVGPRLARARMTNLTYLNLSYILVDFRSFTDRDSNTQSSIELVECLVHMIKLTHLDLSGNNIGVQGAIALASSLPYISKLTYFNISNNNIGTQGAIALASSLPYTSELTTLDLSRNKIHAHGALKIVRNYTHMTKLAHLNLSYNKIGGRGVNALVPCLAHMTNLRYIVLNSNNITKEVIPILKEIFAQMTNLKVDI
jgi:Ran GTPase-activating protein (RanGAP) involved in mRNA processing and transport